MNKNFKAIKTHVSYRADYVSFPQKCPICRKIQGQSKKFKSPYALLYHLTNVHDHEDELNADIKIEEVRQIVKNVVKAYSWGMFLL